MLNKLYKLEEKFGDIFKKIIEIEDKLNVKAYLVGGVVRDIILDKDIYDLDIVVEGDAIEFAEIFASTFKKEITRHHTFGTATVNLDIGKIDFATARKEIYPAYGQLPKVQPASLKDDLFRRDFTINALAISLNKTDYGRVIDFYGGLSDLKNKLIRVLHKNSFLEDPTRILRAIRFEQRFSFRIEKITYKLLKEAIEKNALSLVHPHRLRDEVILILKEENPIRPIKRIAKLCGFSFIDERVKLTREDFQLLFRIRKAILFYQKNLTNRRKLNSWLIYMAIFIYKLPKASLLSFFDRFGLRKGERIILLSIKENFSKIKKLDKKVKPHIIYKLLNILSFETILFFYAYYRKDNIRNNIKYFLKTLVDVRLHIKGADLNKMGIKPSSLYNKIFTKLLYIKMDKNLHTKDEECAELKKIINNLKLLENKINCQ